MWTQVQVEIITGRTLIFLFGDTETRRTFAVFISYLSTSVVVGARENRLRTGLIPALGSLRQAELIIQAHSGLRSEFWSTRAPKRDCLKRWGKKLWDPLQSETVSVNMHRHDFKTEKKRRKVGVKNRVPSFFLTSYFFTSCWRALLCPIQSCGLGDRFCL